MLLMQFKLQKSCVICDVTVLCDQKVPLNRVNFGYFKINRVQKLKFDILPSFRSINKSTQYNKSNF